MKYQPQKPLRTGKPASQAYITGPDGRAVLRPLTPIKNDAKPTFPPTVTILDAPTAPLHTLPRMRFVDRMRKGWAPKRPDTLRPL